LESVARQTSPIPPSPSREWTSKEPRRVPGASVTAPPPAERTGPPPRAAARAPGSGPVWIGSERGLYSNAAAGADLRAGASVGVSLFPDDGTDALRLLSAADGAMYRAKGERPSPPERDEGAAAHDRLVTLPGHRSEERG
jgi:GGDEF domain-containing protein